MTVVTVYKEKADGPRLAASFWKTCFGEPWKEYSMATVREALLLLAMCFTVSCNAIQALQPSVNGVTALKSNDVEGNRFSVAANGVDLHAYEFKDISVASFVHDHAVTIEVKYADSIASFRISPLSKHIQGHLVGKNTLQFTLSTPSYLVVTMNGKDRLFLFGESRAFEGSGKTVSVQSYVINKMGLNTTAIQHAIDETAAKGQTLLFPPGVYRTGKLNVPSNARIIIAAGALLKASDDLVDLANDPAYQGQGFIRIQNARNVRISGLGIIDGNGKVLRDKYSDDARMRIFLVVSSDNVNVEGITARDPGSWNTQILYSNNVSFRNVKLLNDVSLANTDGFDPDASSHVSIENCFAYCGDDNVAIKITKRDGPVKTVSDIKVTGCVFLTHKSSLKVGTESRGVSFRDILFENNDVVMADRGMALYCSDGARYDNIRYVNNRFESNYPDAKREGIHFVVDRRNTDSPAGAMKNIVVKDCRFFEMFPRPSEIKGLDETHRIEVRISNLVINGVKCSTTREAGIKPAFADVTIE
jgi:hypothetical protein